MGDAEGALPPSKKRAAGREISKENPGLDDEEDTSELESGTFKRASDEVLATRRIVKVRRNPASSMPSANPFAGIRLVPPSEPVANPTEVTAEEVATDEKTSAGDQKDDATVENEKAEDSLKLSESKVNEPAADATTDKGSAGENDKSDIISEATKTVVDEKAAGGDNIDNEDRSNKTEVGTDKSAGLDDTEKEDKKDNGSENVNPSAEGTPLSSFQQLSSSQNAFTGLAGTGFSTSSFSFGSIPKDGSVLGTSSGSLFGQKIDQPSFGFGLSNNGSSSLFNTPGASIVSKSEGSSFPSKQEVPVETGEENERVAFSADSVLFEFLNGGWRERGKGEVKVNVSTTGTERARLLMRARGNYRLILNASLYSDMKLTSMDKRSITFACMNSTGEVKDGLSTFALKFKDGTILEEFSTTVSAHKGKTAAVLKTPENSPKASDE